jgi:hypothetical protein
VHEGENCAVTIDLGFADIGLEVTMGEVLALGPPIRLVMIGWYSTQPVLQFINNIPSIAFAFKVQAQKPLVSKAFILRLHLPQVCIPVSLLQ